MVGSTITLRVRRATPKADAHITSPIRKAAHHDGAQRSPRTAAASISLPTLKLAGAGVSGKASAGVELRDRRMDRQVTQEDPDSSRDDDRAEPKCDRPGNSASQLEKKKVQGGHADGAEDRCNPKRHHPIRSRPKPQEDKVSRQPANDRDQDQVKVLLKRAQENPVEADQ